MRAIRILAPKKRVKKPLWEARVYTKATPEGVPAGTFESLEEAAAYERGWLHGRESFRDDLKELLG